MRYLTIAIMVFLLLGCNGKTSGPSGNKVIGTIDLQSNNHDNSGVTIAIFEDVTLNSTITSIQNEHPDLGFIIDQNSEFDHRNQQPVEQTITDEAGNFELNNIPTGFYNIVVMKEGYGFRYIHDIEVFTETDLPTIIMNEETVLSGNVLTDIVFTANSCTYIEDNAVVSLGVNVTFSSDAVIRIAPGAKLEIHGSVLFDTAENPVRITSADKTFEFPANSDDIEKFRKISFSANSQIQGNSIDNVVINHSIGGLTFDTDQTLSVTNMRCNDSVIGFTMYSNGNIEIENCTFTQITDKATVIHSDYSFQNCIVGDSENGIYAHRTDGIINRNYLFDNEIGVKVANLSVSITNNEFIGNTISLTTSGSISTIENNIFSETDIAIDLSTYSWTEFCTPTIVSNNFMQTTTNISIYGMQDFFYASRRPAVTQDINFPNNYFLESDEKLSFIDGNDDDLWADMVWDYIYLSIVPSFTYAISNIGIE